MEITDITTGSVFRDLTVIRKDYGRAVRDNKGSYWRCVCDCGKFLSVRDKDLIDGNIISCKPAGRPCRKIKEGRIQMHQVYHNYKVMRPVNPLEETHGSLKEYYVIQCVDCLKDYSKRGDTIFAGTVAKCVCKTQSTENQKIFS